MAEENSTQKRENINFIKKNPWMGLSAVLGVAVIVLLIILAYPRITGNVVSGTSAGEKLTEFLNGRTGGGVEFISSEALGSNIYSVLVSYQGQQIPVYISKDGKYFIQGAIPMAEEVPTTDTQQPAQQTDVPKSDKPKVELFVMTHCPYGLQAEKGMIPTLKALGSSVDGTIRFVHYFMHGDKEEKETYNQVCIREEQNAKFLDYVSCFSEAGDSAACLKKVGVDTTKLNKCLANNYTVAKKYFKVDQDLSNKYGVQGSPTLIVNGVEASSGRDSASYLNTVCNTFNTKASQCSEKLSSASPGAGFGTAAAASGSNNAAQC